MFRRPETRSLSRSTFWLRMHSSRRFCLLGRGFTLIELLVVVAIITLLISILLPSLNKARAQARTTLCASRMSQMAKAFLIYADDYDETPPFTAYGRGDDPELGVERPDTENWLAGPEALAVMWDQPDEDWPRNWARTGTLFSFTRFEKLYRCPEFERIQHPDNVQNQFNYSRCNLGRQVRIDVDSISDGSGNTPYGIGSDGPIIKPSMAYSTSKLPMVVDEDWYGYIGYHGTMAFSWDQCDPIMDIVDAFIGAYHGAQTAGVACEEGVWDEQAPRKSGSVAMYDGHVELIRDWMPHVGSGDRGGRAFPNPFFEKVWDTYRDMIGQFFYAQRGIASQEIFGGG